ncbi:hypothetical protein HMPREF1477_01614 [Veillonella sp. HPA0037]|uniref:hypothetical protein n=1 Tax=Veillonella TaxID=29465 RepID=UPI00034E3D28|nr:MULTISPECIES: hypothetical protein [Veillonella]EPD77577.1 hypothetical protein HMPREF1477_01614 [Veillonella sp. HPA0037]
MKHMLSRTALMMAVLSALGTASVGAVDAGPTIPEVKNAVAVVKAPAADESSKTGWLAEQLAVTAFGDSLQYWQAASENDGVMPQDSKNNLADIGRSYTSNNLPALGDEDDYSLAQKPESEDGTSIGPVYRVGDVYVPSPSAQKTVKGVFTTYHEKDMDITVYTGPDKSRLVDNQLRGQGATYLFPVGTITNLHTTDKGLVTIRDIGVGSSRMEMIFSYGSPNAMWRNQTDESYIFLYEGHSENSWPEKKEFSSSVANTNNNSQLPETIQNGKSYVAFTIKNNTVEAVDILDGQVWSRFGLPKAPMYSFHAGQLTEDDFVLRGLHLNQHFVNDANGEWRTQGMLFGSTFIGYNEYGVSVDGNSLINRVLLNVYTPTRRGIAMGDTKYLLLFVYGMPTRIAESTTSTGTATVYEYKNPRSNNSYLQFALDDKNQYIKSVMLSDRPVK